MEIFQERLRLARKSKGITQEEAAKQLGISLRTYRRCETGEAEPGIFTVVAIANLYETSIDYLTGRVDE